MPSISAGACGNYGGRTCGSVCVSLSGAFRMKAFLSTYKSLSNFYKSLIKILKGLCAESVAFWHPKELCSLRIPTPKNNGALQTYKPIIISLTKDSLLPLIEPEVLKRLVTGDTVYLSADAAVHWIAEAFLHGDRLSCANLLPLELISRL